MSEDPTGNASEPRQARMTRARVVALVVTLLLVAGVAVAIGITAGSDAPGNAAGDMPQMATPLDLASVSPNVAAHYRYVKAHQDAYSQIPCFCGCDKSLGHRSLRDCYIQADGAGWEAHASGCGVCVAESVTARRLLNGGRDPTAVREAVIAEFGSMTGTPPPLAGQ